VCIQKHRQVRRAVAAILAVITLGPARRWRNRLTHSADQLCQAFIEAHNGILRNGLFSVKVKDILPGLGYLLASDYDMPPLMPTAAIFATTSRAALERTLVTEGFEVTCGESTICIKEGETARYPADTSRCISNVGGKPAHGLLVVLYR
jgi:hypothetical protein